MSTVKCILPWQTGQHAPCGVYWSLRGHVSRGQLTLSQIGPPVGNLHMTSMWENPTCGVAICGANYKTRAFWQYT